MTEKGKTVVDILAERNIKVSRERARQMFLEHYSIAVRELARKPEWYLRRAKILSEEVIKILMTKEGMEKALAETGGCEGLAQKLKVSGSTLRMVCNLLAIDPTLPRVHGEMISFSCTFCGKPVYRLKKYEEKERKKKQHFCNQICHGYWLGKNHGGGRSKEKVSN